VRPGCNRLAQTWYVALVRCFACNARVSAEDVAQGRAPSRRDRVGFRDTCQSCGADLHVCLNCAHHDPQAYNECRESSAERVSERERANRCEYFAPGRDAAGDEGGTPRPAEAAARARAELEALFKK